MTYEEYLDEVTTLIVEKYDVADEVAIALVMKAQAGDYFTLHDDQENMRTLARAHQDAKHLFEKAAAKKSAVRRTQK